MFLKCRSPNTSTLGTCREINEGGKSGLSKGKQVLHRGLLSLRGFHTALHSEHSLPQVVGDGTPTSTNFPNSSPYNPLVRASLLAAAFTGTQDLGSPDTEGRPHCQSPGVGGRGLVILTGVKLVPALVPDKRVDPVWGSAGKAPSKFREQLNTTKEPSPRAGRRNWGCAQVSFQLQMARTLIGLTEIDDCFKVQASSPANLNVITRSLKVNELLVADL